MPVMEMIKENSSITEEERILKAAKKIQQNIQEDASFSKKLTDLLDNKLPSTEVLILGETPNVLRLIGSKSEKLTINQSVIKNCMNEEDIISHGHTSGHALSLDIMKQLPEAIRNPIMICNGSKSGTVVVVTELKNRDDKNVIVPIAIDVRGKTGVVSNILTAYGKDNLQKIIDRGVIAQNIEKASELFTVIEANPSQSTSITCFDNSIAYTTENVKYPENDLTENTQFHEPIEHEKLLPFLNAKAQFHESRLESLREKRGTQLAKLKKNEAKIEKLTSKAVKLEDLNKLLENLARNNPAIRSFVERNEARINAIRNEKIPARQEKIKAHQKRISEIDKKSEIIGHKLERCAALSDTVKSFALVGAKRREVFAESLDKLNHATYNCIKDRRSELLAQREALEERYNRIPEGIDISSAVDREKLRVEINKVKPKLDKLDKKLAKIKLPEDTYAKKNAEDIDRICDNTRKIVTESVEQGDVSVAKLSENICESNAEIAAEIDKNIDIEVAESAEALESAEVLKNVEVLENVETSENEIDEEAAVSTTEIPDDKDWLDTLIEQDKAVINYDGSFKINQEYYNWLGKNGRHIERVNSDAADKVMQDLFSKGIEFSAVSRTRDIVAITVANSDAIEFKESFDKFSNNGPAAKSEETISESRANNTLKINPEYYDSLDRRNRLVSSVPKDKAMKIMAELDNRGVLYSAAGRKNDFVAITVSKQNESKFKAAERIASKEIINSDYYKSLPPKDRYTQRMPQEQAQQAVRELTSAGIEHSAVLDDEKSAVTISKNDYKQAKEKTALFSRKKMNDIAKKMKNQERKEPSDKTKSKKQNKDVGL